MDGLGWLIVIVLLFLFGKNFNLSGVLNTSVIANAVPTPNGLPALITQDQVTGNPVATPAPWTNQCQAQQTVAAPASNGLGLVNVSAANLNLPGSNLRGVAPARFLQ